ncbi:hypothetical protein RvVAT039_20230 [Agrobacterium vitis]|nr:hypothetical protein RvVAT039_20230 [Agrobacterium vitis]
MRHFPLKMISRLNARVFMSPVSASLDACSSGAQVNGLSEAFTQSGNGIDEALKSAHRIFAFSDNMSLAAAQS